MLAHELSHVKNRDILIATIAAAVAGLVSSIGHVMQWGLMLGGSARRATTSAAAAWLRWPGSSSPPIMALLIQLAISRSRELGADASGAALCGHPENLAGALLRLEQAQQIRPYEFAGPATAHLFIVNPLRGAAATFMNLLSTHPPDRGAHQAAPGDAGLRRRATLIVSAFEPEIAPLRKLVRGRRGIALEPVGIGAIDAAVGASRAIAGSGPIGSSSSVRPGFTDARRKPLQAMETAVVAGEVLCMSTAALKGDAYLPGPMVVQVPTSRACGRRWPARGAGSFRDVACPLAITRSAALGRRIAEATGATLENLEAFAVARAAGAAGLAFAAVLGVANRVGPTGHEEWQRHHRAASRAACKLIARFLDVDADGAVAANLDRPRRT